MKIILNFIFFLFSTATLSYASDFDTDSNLGTLFTSHTERSYLNKLRKTGKFDQRSVQTKSSLFFKPVNIKMQGLVLRSSNKPVVFLNDTNNLFSNTINKQIIVNHSSIKPPEVPLRFKNNTIRLKPGQNWNESERRAIESYQIKNDTNKSGSLSKKIVSKIIK